MDISGQGLAGRCRNEFARCWFYVVEYLTSDLSPWDRGVLEAHWVAGAPDRKIEDYLRRAKSRRRGPLAWISPWRRRYLDGMVWGLDRELRRRSALPRG
jgi:hypothetical protein